MKHILTNTFVLKHTALWVLLMIYSILLMQYLHGSPLSLSEFIISWDGNWYASIIERGYSSGEITSQMNIAFFPLYPVIVYLFSIVTFLPLWLSGAIVSLASLFVALCLIYDYLGKEGRTIQEIAVLCVLYNPWSFYFLMFYTESLFLLLSVSVFWAIKRSKWFLAVILAGLATATRAPGIILSLIVFYAWFQALKTTKPLSELVTKSFFIGLTSVSGALLFMAFLHVNNGDFLAFKTVQQYWPGRNSSLWSEIANLFKYLSPSKFNLQYSIEFMWLMCSMAGLFCGAYLVKVKRHKQAFFMLASIAIALSTGSVTSMNRYILVLFPIYFVIARMLSKKSIIIRYSAFMLSGFALLLMIYLITRPDMPFLG